MSLFGGFDFRPSPSRRALAELGRTRRALDALERRLVDQARRGGASWSELGADLGLTKEGARRRHVDHDPRPSRPRRDIVLPPSV